MKNIILTILFTVFVFGCSKKEETYGSYKPSKSDVISLSEVISTPDNFHKKDVTLKGFVDGQCGNRCEFSFRENNDVIKIHMGDIKAPAIKKGTSVIVSASVYKGKEQTILTAKGFTLITKDGK